MHVDIANVVIDQSTCCTSVHTVTVHHRNFPEIAVEAISASRAVAHLERLLERALDCDAETWLRESIQQAVAEVRLCGRALADSPRPGTTAPKGLEVCDPGCPE
jgi:hypothetical protein